MRARVAVIVAAVLVAACEARSSEDKERPIPECEALLSTQRACLAKSGEIAASRAETQIAAMRQSLYTEAAKGTNARTAVAARCAAEDARMRTSCR